MLHCIIIIYVYKFVEKTVVLTDRAFILLIINPRCKHEFEKDTLGECLRETILPDWQRAWEVTVTGIFFFGRASVGTTIFLVRGNTDFVINRIVSAWNV